VPFDIANGESPRFTGRGVAALAADENRIEKTGRVIPVIDLASEYGFTDVDGRQPGNIAEQMGIV
jgi:dehydrogenase/reductase SDR family protein 1